MASENSEPKLGTPTVVMLTGIVFKYLSPWLVGFGHWIMAHTLIVFPPDYLKDAPTDAAIVIIALVVAWHTGAAAEFMKRAPTPETSPQQPADPPVVP